MRDIVGVAIIVVGVLGSLYLGGYVLFFGGIVALINAMKDDLNAVVIAVSVVRIIFATTIGTIGCWLSLMVGYLVCE